MAAQVRGRTHLPECWPMFRACHIGPFDAPHIRLTWHVSKGDPIAEERRSIATAR